MVRDWQEGGHQLKPHQFTTYGFTDTQDMHRPPMQIDEALRQHCGISARRYLVAVIMDDGSPMTFSDPGTAGLEGNIMRQVFDPDIYQRVMECLDLEASPVVDQNSGLNRGYFPRNRMFDLDEWGLPGRPGRKRPRARYPVDEDDDAPLAVSSTRKGFQISSSQDMWNFYEQRFNNCQQTAYKLIAKAWVKAVEPKKQSIHPYTGGDKKAPEWWPKPWGPTTEDKVHHKEPDHLYKRERVYLLNHILRMIVEPKDKQHPDIQKLNLNIKKLKEITTKALLAFFADKENSPTSKSNHT